MTTAVDQQEASYSSARVVELTGVTYRQLDRYARLGRLSTATPAQGSGSRREFSHLELETVYHAVRLQRIGFTAAASLQIAHELVESGSFSTAVGEIFTLTIGLKP